MGTKTFKGMVLLVTTTDSLKTSLERALLRAGYGLRVAKSQTEGLEILRYINVACIVVDRRESGFAQLHHALPDGTPILTVSHHPGQCNEHHCISDIEDGAARAVCNASPSVIVALIHAVLRRQSWQQPAPDYFATEGVTIDFANYEVKVGTTVVPVTPTQFRILRCLALAPGQFLSRQALFDQVWGKGFAICPHTLDVTLSSLRRTLYSSGASPDFILTLKGVGFKLRPTVPQETVRSLPAATTITSGAQPAVGAFWNAGNTPAVFRHSAVNRRVPTARPLVARYRTKPQPAASKQTSSCHLDGHYTDTDSSCRGVLT